MRLEGKVAIVTGTSPNILGGIAYGLAGEGAKVVCVDLKPEYANQCAASIKKLGGEAIGVVCDVTDEEQVKAAVARSRETYGGVDILINGAAIFNEKGVLEMPLDEWRRQVDIILTGMFLFTKYAAELMIEQGRKGCIINIASTEAYQGNPGNIAYCTAKAGLLNFTRSSAMELAEYGIRVNALAPTATDPSEARQRAADWGVQWPPPRGGRRRAGGVGIPLGVWPKPSDYAKGAVFLASDDAAMVTGFDLRVDAGNIARYWGWLPPATPNPFQPTAQEG